MIAGLLPVMLRNSMLQSFKLPILLSLLVIAGAVFFFGSSAVFQKEKASAPFSEPNSTREQDSSALPSLAPPVTEPWFVEGTFSNSEGLDGQVEVTIQKAEDSDAPRLTWDESQFRVFHVALFDADKIEQRADNDILLWRISSWREFPERNEPFTRENITGFLSSGYVLGEERTGFDSLEIPEEFQPFKLEQRTRYYLQLIGFGNDDSEVTVNKTFTFTDSCLPPSYE